MRFVSFYRGEKRGVCNGYVTFRFPAAVSTDLTALIP